MADFRLHNCVWNMARRNRSETSVYLVGQPAFLESCSSLPTTRDVLCDYFARRDDNLSSGVTDQRYVVAKDTYEALLIFWQKANIPTISKQGCIHKILTLWREWGNLKKKSKS